MNRKIQQGREQMDSVYALILKDVKVKAKSMAALDNLSLTQLIETLITDYVNHKIKINARNPSTPGK